MIVAARAKTEMVAVYSLVLPDVLIIRSKTIPLVVGKLPIRRTGTAYVLQVALGEMDFPIVCINGEFAEKEAIELDVLHLHFH